MRTQLGEIVNPTLGQPRWEGFHPGCASLGTGGDSRTIRESEETRKSSKRRPKPPRKPQEKDRQRNRASRCRVLRTSCIRSAYVPRTPAYVPRTLHVRLRMPCTRSTCCCNLTPGIPVEKGSHKNGSLSETPSSRSVRLSAAWCGDMTMTRSFRLGLPRIPDTQFVLQLSLSLLACPVGATAPFR